MELDVTALIAHFGDSPERFSDSVSNSGFENIGQVTWRNALAVAKEVMLVDDSTRGELVDHFAGYGAGERTELEAFSDAELNALLVQFISGDYQEYIEAEEAGALEAYQENHGGTLYKSDTESSDDVHWFYYVGT